MIRKVLPAAIYLATHHVDMRKSIDGLSVLVAERLGYNPLAGQMFIFFNRSRDKVKILYWERNGFCLWYKRLEKHRFHIPSKLHGESISITEEQLVWLLDGLDITHLKRHPTLRYTTIK